METDQKKSIWTTSLKENWQNFLEWSKTPQGKKGLIIFSIIFIVVLITGITVYNRYFAKGKSSTSTNNTVLPKMSDSKSEEPKKIQSYLDGQLYAEDVANRHPLAIMVENHSDARPQSGLDKAKVVYEAVTEGGITRFMAIFGPESVSKVGPVRSARTYYLDWALEYDAFYAHVGGNLDALDLIPQLKIKDLDQFKYGSQAYWRIPQAGKATEHTMFTDTGKLWAIAKDNKWDMNAKFDSLAFKTDVPKEQRPESQNISIDFSTPTYKVTWKYDKNSDSYLRYIAGATHKDAITGQQLSAKNVIIQEVQRWEAPTKINEAGWAMKTVGNGKAKIIIDGKVIEGTWKKENHNSRTLFSDNDGKEIQFNPGNFWYEIVPPGTSVTIG